jgi:hypothetical protein
MTKNRLINDDEPVIESAASAAPARSDAPVVPPQRPVEESARPPQRKNPYANQRKVTGYVDSQTFMWLKSIHAQTNKTMMAIMEEALTEYVQRYAAKQKFGAGQGG